jgi:hypothetical protein
LRPVGGGKREARRERCAQDQGLGHSCGEREMARQCEGFV